MLRRIHNQGKDEADGGVGTEDAGGSDRVQGFCHFFIWKEAKWQSLISRDYYEVIFQASE